MGKGEAVGEKLLEEVGRKNLHSTATVLNRALLAMLLFCTALGWTGVGEAMGLLPYPGQPGSVAAASGVLHQIIMAYVTFLI